MRAALGKWSALVALTAMGVACNPNGDKGPDYLAIDAAKVNAAAQRHLTSHLSGAAKAVAVLDDSRLVGDLMGGEGPECPEGTLCSGGGAGGNFDYDEAADAIATWLSENVFTNDSVESDNGTAVVYRLRPEVICGQDDGEGEEVLDEECVTVLTEHPFRLTVRSQAEDELEIYVTIGEHHVGDFELFSTHLSATANLEGIAEALRAIATTLEEDLDGFPDVLTGSLRAALIRDGDEAYTLAFSVNSSVVIASGEAGDDDFYNVELASADALRVSFDAQAGTVVPKVDFKGVRVEAALELIAGGSGEECEWIYNDALGYDEWVCTAVEREPYTGTILVNLAGVNGEGILDVTQELLSLTGLGLGDETSTVKFNNETVLALDVNAYAGRRFDLTIADVDGGVDFTFSPGLALGLSHSLEALAEQLEDIPGWLLSGSSHVALDEADAPKVRLFDGGSSSEEEEEGPEAIAQVLAGRLALSASALDEAIRIEAPQCVVPSEEEDTEHPFALFTSGSCE